MKIEDLKTPKQIVWHNKLKWRPQQIGVLFSLKLVRGYKNGHSVLIYEPDVLELYARRN